MALRHLQNKLRRSAYSAAQFAKVGWYTTQYIGARHISGPLTPPGEVPKPFQSAPTSQAALRKAFLHLLAQEARDIEKGVYKLPKAFRTPPSPLRLAKQAKSYFKEARAVAVRSKTKGGATEVREGVEGDYPSYYLQNFHFQTDGWLSESSAKIYDTQVEALFTGAAATMRRRLLPPLLTEVAKLQEKDVSIHIADIGCGTGRLVAEIVDNAPNVKITGIDLSKAYLDVARDYVGTKKSVSFMEGAAETLPFEDDSVDILTSVYLFHELPPKIRREVASEIARVLKPGGLYIHADSLQYGDTDLDLLLEAFPRAFHEPFYDGYCREDLSVLFGEQGFSTESQELAFLTKVNSFRLKTPGEE